MALLLHKSFSGGCLAPSEIIDSTFSTTKFIENRDSEMWVVFMTFLTAFFIPKPKF